MSKAPFLLLNVFFKKYRGVKDLVMEIKNLQIQFLMTGLLMLLTK